MLNSLLDLLTEKMILLNVPAKDWEDALRKGAQLLINSGGVESRYTEAMIKMVKDLGPFVVVAPGLALGHAGSDAGVYRTCFSLITLEKPVNFGVPENDPVDLIFSFAAPNKEEHMQALRDMALFCCENKNLEGIRKAKSPFEVMKLLKIFFKENKSK